MTYSVEVDAKSGWLQVCTCRTFDDAKTMAKHYACELERDARVARYRPEFNVLFRAAEQAQ